jgi:glycine/sarcosine/betaine reductase complex component A
MDLATQARIKELAEGERHDDLVVVIGHLDVGGAELAAETVTAGDPTWAGPLAGVPLGLPVYHVLEPEVKGLVAPDAYEQHLGLMEMVLESDAPIQAVRKVRERTPSASA